MLFNKEDIVISLQEKANEKIEALRHEMAQSLFEFLNEEVFFVYDKKNNDIAGGPFATRQKAMEYVKEMNDKNLVVMTERDLEKKLGGKA